MSQPSARTTSFGPHEHSPLVPTTPAESGDWIGALRYYLATVTALNLVWEFIQMPLYTIWRTGTWREIVFAAVHCTGGDVLIALTTLTLALLLVGNRHWPRRRFASVASLTIVTGLCYTIFSEWLNIAVRAAWGYSDLMPVVPVFGFPVGFSPVAQWLLVPMMGFWFVHRRR